MRRLLEAPIESATLPKGWEWAYLALGEYEWPLLPSPAALSGALKRAGNEDLEVEATLWLACQPNADLVLARTSELKVQSGAIEHIIGPIGDGTVAFTYMTEDWPILDELGDADPSIPWRDGDVLGRVVGYSHCLPDVSARPRRTPIPSEPCPEFDLGTLEAVAQSVSDVLVASGLTGPITDDDACVRQVLGAPVETLGGEYFGVGVYVFPTVTPMWVADDFFLGCQRNAALVLERAAEVAAQSWATDFDGSVRESDIAPIGDGSIVFETIDSDGHSDGITILWRNGDALGEIDASASWLGSAETLARSVSALLGTAGCGSDDDEGGPGRRLPAAPPGGRPGSGHLG